MAFNAKVLSGVAFFIFSVTLWGVKGCFILLLGLIKSPRAFFKKNDNSTLPEVAKDPALGKHDHVILKSSQNLKIKYVANGEKGKPLMLCVHGFPECWYSWRHQLKEFSDKYWVVAIDLPGYGDSDKPEGKEPYLVENLTRYLSEIITELGYEKATMVAHDWGGAIVWAFAVQYADLCEKVVIMNAPNRKGFQKGFSFKQYCNSWYMFFFQLPCLPELMLGANNMQMLDAAFRGTADGAMSDMGVKNKKMMTEDDVKVYKYALHTWGARQCAVNYYRANNLLRAVLNPPPRSALSAKLTAPTLLIWGTGDAALSIELARYSAEMSDLITVEYVENCSHWVQQDNPSEVNRLMRKFL